MCPTITVDSFFQTRKVHFFVHLFINLKPQQLQTSTTPPSEAHPKRKEKTKVFWIASEGLPFICFDILQHNGCQKIAKGPPFYIFWHCDTVQKSHLKIFLGKFFHVSKGSPLQFFKFFATSWSFTKPEGSLF